MRGRQAKAAILPVIKLLPIPMSSGQASGAVEITQWLVRWREGDTGALDHLTRMVYAELRHMAAALLQLERGGHTLQPTALVHELYLRLEGARGVDWKCRGQFFAISAKVMRRILVDHARKRTTAKRAGDLLTLDGEALMVPAPDVLLVDAALSRLARDYPRQAAVVELRFFGGLTAEETVEAMTASGEEVSLRTVQRDWRFSRAWLQDAL
jgi:RNA polymerase sigma-70 factor (ECF subfamily)